MMIVGIGAIVLCATGKIAGESAVVLLGAILGYAFGYTNGNNKKAKEETKPKTQ